MPVPYKEWQRVLLGGTYSAPATKRAVVPDLEPAAVCARFWQDTVGYLARHVHSALYPGLPLEYTRCEPGAGALYLHFAVGAPGLVRGVVLAFSLRGLPQPNYSDPLGYANMLWVTHRERVDTLVYRSRQQHVGMASARKRLRRAAPPEALPMDDTPPTGSRLEVIAARRKRLLGLS